MQTHMGPGSFKVAMEPRGNWRNAEGNRTILMEGEDCFEEVI